jgi:predicted transcriptional regulator
MLVVYSLKKKSMFIIDELAVGWSGLYGNAQSSTCANIIIS